MKEVASTLTLQQLKTLFPGLSSETTQRTSASAIIKYQGQSWYLMDTSLSERECQLLALHGVEVEPLFSNTKLTVEQEMWQQFLLMKGKLPGQPFRKKERVQVLYIYVHGLNPIDQKLFEQTLQEAVVGLEVLFPQMPNFWIGVVSEGIDQEVLQSILQTLEIDFAITIQAVLGLSNVLSYDLAERTLTEWDFVRQQLPLPEVLPELLLPLPDLLLRSIRAYLVSTNIVLPHIAHYLRESREMAQIVEVLFQTQGNLSQAAENLYIHRNTLMYRLTKYTKETGLNLQRLSDLVVSYLALGGKEG